MPGNRQRLVSASGDQTIRMWDWSTRKPASILRGHLSEVQGLAMSPTGRTLASACKDGSIYLWDLDRPTGHPAFQTLPPAVYSAVFTPNSRSVVAAERSGGVAQFDVQSLRRVRQWRDPATNNPAQSNPGLQRGYYRTVSPDAAEVALFRQAAHSGPGQRRRTDQPPWRL